MVNYLSQWDVKVCTTSLGDCPLQVQQISPYKGRTYSNHDFTEITKSGDLCKIHGGTKKKKKTLIKINLGSLVEGSSPPRGMERVGLPHCRVTEKAVYFMVLPLSTNQQQGVGAA